LFQGIEVGRVLEVGVEADSRDLSFRMPVIFETYPQRLTILNEDPDETHGERVRRLVDHGMRVQLAPANLLTGARNLMLDFRPESPMVFRGGATDLPEMPTVPSTGEAIADVLGQLPEIVADLRDTVHGVSEIINATGTAETLSSLRSSAASLDQLLATLGTESGPLLSSLDDVLTDMRALVTGIDVVVSDVQAGTPELMGTLQETFDAALGLVQSSDRGVSTVVSGMPAIQQELTSALHEIASGMRSLAGLAEFLERHPEALLRGKTDTGGL
jgi:paraquat-inducible protein B